MKMIIALGSNLPQEQNLLKAKELLGHSFDGITFSEPEWTEPIGIKSDRFLNCIGTFEAELSRTAVEKILKRTEQAMGDSHQNHQLGKVLIDIDLIQYGNETIRKIAWL